MAVSDPQSLVLEAFQAMLDAVDGCIKDVAKESPAVGAVTEAELHQVLETLSHRLTRLAVVLPKAPLEPKLAASSGQQLVATLGQLQTLLHGLLASRCAAVRGKLIRISGHLYAAIRELFMQLKTGIAALQPGSGGAESLEMPNLVMGKIYQHLEQLKTQPLNNCLGARQVIRDQLAPVEDALAELGQVQPGEGGMTAELFQPIPLCVRLLKCGIILGKKLSISLKTAGQDFDARVSVAGLDFIVGAFGGFSEVADDLVLGVHKLKFARVHRAAAALCRMLGDVASSDFFEQLLRVAASAKPAAPADDARDAPEQPESGAHAAVAECTAEFKCPACSWFVHSPVSSAPCGFPHAQWSEFLLKTLHETHESLFPLLPEAAADDDGSDEDDEGDDIFGLAGELDEFDELDLDE